MFNRQNSPKAINLLKASAYCHINEKALKYTVLVLSVAVCVLGICNRFLLFMDPQWLILISAVVLITQTFFNSRVRKYRMERVSMMEMFDTYVYSIPENLLMMRPMQEVIVENYASKVKDKKKKLQNYYFTNRFDAEAKHAVLDNQYKYFEEEYRLLLFVRKYFYVIWSLFFVALLGMSISINDAFLTTILNIFIPSLSLTILIISSWANLNNQVMVFQNCMVTLGKIKKEGRVNMSSDMFLRTTQDAIFKNRSAAFMIPAVFNSYYLRVRHKKEKKPKVATPKPVTAKAKPAPKKSAPAKKPAPKSKPKK